MSRELMCKHGLWPHENCKACAYRDKVEQQVCPKCNQEMGNPHHCRPDWSGPSIGGKEVNNA